MSMASKSSIRTSPDRLRKVAGAQPAEGNTRRTSPLAPTKPSRLEPATPNRLPSSLQHVPPKQVVSDVTGDKKSFHALQKGSTNGLTENLRLSDLSLVDEKQVPAHMVVQTNGTKSSLEHGALSSVSLVDDKQVPAHMVIQPNGTKSSVEHGALSSLSLGDDKLVPAHMVVQTNGNKSTIEHGALSSLSSGDDKQIPVHMVIHTNGPKSSIEHGALSSLSSVDEKQIQADGFSGLNEHGAEAHRRTPEQGVGSSSAKVSDGGGSLPKTSGSAKTSGQAEFVESGKSSMYRPSTSSDVSDESTCSSLSSVNKPHKANDVRWEAIQAIRGRDGMLGLNHFRLLKRLGCGDIGSVYLSELTGTKCYFAMKVMDKASLASRKKLLRAQTEREILQSLDHPFLPTLYTHFETEKFSCLVMEFCPGGDLHTLRQRQPGKYFTEQAVKFYVAEILLAMEYLHMLGIIYRDLKPENVLVREDGHIMLSDFDLSLRCAVSPTLVKSATLETQGLKKSSGYCAQPACIEPSCIQPSCVASTTCFTPRFFSSKSKKEKKTKPSKNELGNQVSPLPELMAEPTNARSMSFVGTHEYLAPEIIKGEGHGSAVDWWTLGIFLYELLFGKTPFKGSGNRATLFNVVGQPLRFPESPAVSFQARDLIRGLLVKEPQHRLAYKRGATEIKQHPFFEGVNWALIRCASPPEIPRPVELDRVPPPPTSSSAKATVAGMVDQKGSDNYLEFDFF